MFNRAVGSVAKAVGVSGVDNRFPGEKHALLRVNGKTVVANFMGPGTKLKQRLQRGDEPVSDIDKVSLAHDLRYMLAKTKAEIQEADRLFLAKARTSNDSVYNKGLGLTAIGAKYAAEKLAGVRYPTQAELDANDSSDSLLAPRMASLAQQGYGGSGGREQLILASVIAALKKEDPSRLDDITQAVLYPTRMYSEEEKRIWQQIISDFSLGNPNSSTGSEFALNRPSNLSEYEGSVEMGKPDPGDILGLSQNVDYSYHNPLFKTQEQLDADQEGPHFSLYHAVELNPRLRLFANQFSPLSLIRPMPTRAFNAPAISSIPKIKSAAQYQDAAIHDAKMNLLTDAENKILEEKNAVALKQRYEMQLMQARKERGQTDVDVEKLQKTHEAVMKTFDDRLKKLQAQRQQGLAGVSNT